MAFPAWARPRGNPQPAMATVSARIDADLCQGCASCVAACVEGAIELVRGDGGLLRASAVAGECVGHGRCVYACPEGAIRLEASRVLRAV